MSLLYPENSAEQSIFSEKKSDFSRFQNASPSPFSLPECSSAPLGSITKSDTTYESKTEKLSAAETRENARILRYREQNIASEILPDFRVKSCLKILNKNLNQVGIQRHLHGSCSFSGLVPCGSIWVCSICHARIMERRKIEIAAIFKHWLEQGRKQAFMLTFTIPHSVLDALEKNLDAVIEGYRSLVNSRVWSLFAARIGYSGCIKSVEILWGSLAGWHPHVHAIWFLDWGIDLNLQKMWIVDRWIKCLVNAGLKLTEQQKSDMLDHSIDITKANSGDYLAKIGGKSSAWGVEAELTKATKKKSKRDLLSPFELLELSKSEPKYGELFREYALATKGKARISISKNLSAAAGLVEKTDEQLNQDIEVLKGCAPLGYIDKKFWYEQIIKFERRAEVLKVAETEGIEGLKRLLGAAFEPANQPSEELLDAIGKSELERAKQDRASDAPYLKRRKAAVALSRKKLEAKQAETLAVAERKATREAKKLVKSKGI